MNFKHGTILNKIRSEFNFWGLIFSCLILPHNERIIKLKHRKLNSNFILFRIVPCSKLYHITWFISGRLLNLLTFFIIFTSRFKIHIRSSDYRWKKVKVLFALHFRLSENKVPFIWSVTNVTKPASQDRRACGLFAANGDMNYTEILNYACR